ncbi:MAG: aminotransferase class V-fold PLP-dependent enzyme [Anaerolineae bacterium]|nr:aminotransferase class V-fold PLP-dependent enzyme [Anaerolineae bacterium]
MITTPAYPLTAARAAFPIAERLTYLNHASISPMPLPAAQAMQRATLWLADDPMTFFTPGSEVGYGDLFATFSQEMAALIGAAHPHEVVGTQSTSSGINAVAQAIDWQPGDNIVLVDVEFPSNVYPWMVLGRRGVECRLAPADGGGATVEALDALTDERTRLIAVSAVQFFTGQRADLAAIGAYCQQRGILFAVDAIQAAGHLPIDVEAMHIDILASGGQKSLMGPPGQGFLYVREAVAERMVPGIVGPNATDGWEHWIQYDLTPRPGAQRFMMGTPNIAGMIGLIESVRFLRGLGVASIDAWTRHLSGVTIAELSARGQHIITPSDPAHLGPIVTLRVGDPADLPAAEARTNGLLDHLAAHGVRVTKHWDAARAPHLRISTHCYNTEDEVRRACALVEDYHG